MSRAPRWLTQERLMLLMLDADVADHLVWCRAAGFTDKTISARRDLLARLLGETGTPLAEQTAQRLASYLARPEWSPATREIYHRHLTAFYGWRVTEGRSEVNPMATLPRPRVTAGPPREPVADDVAQQLMAEAEEPWRTAVMLAYLAGLRAMEVAAVRREDVTERRILVHGKGNKTAHVPTHPLIWSHVRDRPAGHLVRSRSDNPLSPAEVSLRFASYMRRSWHREDVSMHRFRHGFARRLRRAGVDPRVIQTLLRHENLNTTMRYLAVDEDERTAAIGAI